MSESTHVDPVFINIGDSKMFEPIKVGKVQLANRLVYSACTRCRSEPGTYVATDSMLEYYTRRARNNGGLLVYEGSSPNKSFGTLFNSPIIETPEQVAGMKKIVDSVHKEGSFISLQLAHLGRFSVIPGVPCRGPSKVYINEEHKKNLELAGIELEALTVEQIKEIIADFVAAAKRAIDEAGFDFIEFHGGNGLLIDQFTQETANIRTDQYGGSIENRARFVLELIDACIEAVGADHVAVKFSPYGTNFGSGGNKIDPIVQWGYILSELESRAQKGKRIAYVCLVEPRSFQNDTANLEWVSCIWKGVISRTGNYLDKSNIKKLGDFINSHENTIIAVGRQYTSNPDLVNRLKNGYPLTPYDRPTFYTPSSNVGYLTFTKYGEDEDHSKDDVAPIALV